MPVRELFRRHVAIPADHGSWVFLFSPLLIGLFAGRAWSWGAACLVLAALAGFLLRQPLTLLVKVRSGRRGRDGLPAIRFWIAVWGLLAALCVAELARRGFAWVLLLAAPGVPVFVWQLWLVSRRAERRQWLVEVVGSGVLALTAPAALWIGVGRPDPFGWLLWALVWAQSAASIDHAYLRLAQRTAGAAGTLARRLRAAVSPFALASLGLVAAASLGGIGLVSRWLFVPYAVQWLEVLYGAVRPAVGLKPRSIGLRQLVVSTAFTVLFILTGVRGERPLLQVETGKPGLAAQIQQTVGQRRRVPGRVFDQRIGAVLQHHVGDRPVALRGRLDHEQSPALAQHDQVPLNQEQRDPPEPRLLPQHLAALELDRPQLGIAAAGTAAPVDRAFMVDRGRPVRL
jgi:hypothetical protein